MNEFSILSLILAFGLHYMCEKSFVTHGNFDYEVEQCRLYTVAGILTLCLVCIIMECQ